MKKQILLLFTLFMFCFVNITTAQEVKINHDGTDGLAVEADGTLRADGAATTWEDLKVPLSEPSTGKVKPDWNTFPYGLTAGTTPYINWFRASGVDEMYFVVQLPHNWNEGTTIFPHIHWVPSQNGASGPTLPRWGLQYAWLNLGDTFSSYTTIYGRVTTTSEVLVKDRQYITPLSNFFTPEGNSLGIDGSGKTISSMLICRIFRDGDDAADDYAGLAGALEVDFHYQINTMGSRSEFTK